MIKIRSIKRLFCLLVLCLAARVAGTDETSPGTKIGSAAPAFSLSDQDGRSRGLADFKGRIVVLEWTNPNCPFVQRHYREHTMVDLYQRFHDKGGQGVEWLAINSTGRATVEQNRNWAKSQSLPYPILDDHAGATGKAYGAVTTPSLFIVDKDGKLAYVGGIDNDPQGEKGQGRVNYVARALGELFSGNAVSIPFTKSYGCHVAYVD